jgi:hypothetical protein
MQVDKYVGSLWEEHKVSFISTDYHIVSSAPTSYRINIGLQYITVFRRVNGMLYFHILSAKLDT